MIWRTVKWTIEVEMQCFATIHAEVTVVPNMPASSWEMKLLPQAQLVAQAQQEKPVIEIPSLPAETQTGEETRSTNRAEQRARDAQGTATGKRAKRGRISCAGQRQQRGDFAVRYQFGLREHTLRQQGFVYGRICGHRREFGAECASLFAERR
jgi:hypothetical protein